MLRAMVFVLLPFASLACGSGPAGSTPEPAPGPVATPASEGSAVAAEREPRVEAEPTVAPVPAVVEAPPAEVISAIAPDELVAAETQWFCLCIVEDDGAGSHDTTACRPTREECNALFEHAEERDDDAIAVSGYGCDAVTAVHPGDVPGWGGRARWAPSRRPGGWQSVGTCWMIDDT